MTDGSGKRIVLVALGTRGDVQPFCVLGTALRAAGYRVTLLTTADYRRLVESFGLDLVEIGPAFDTLITDPKVEALFRTYFSVNWRMVGALRALSNAVQGIVAQMMVACLAEMGSADLVVYNAMAFFAGEFAQERGIASIRVLCQPLLPSRRMPLPLFGDGDRGPVLNRLSYEAFRVLPLLLRRAFRTVRRTTGAGRRLRALTNPLTLGIARSHQMMAFSPLVSPDPGDWPAGATATGFWYNEPRPDETLPERVAAFLAAGAPPVYVGFGSMLWGKQRNTDMVLRALALWGGRAILATTSGALAPEGDLPPNVLPVSGLNHMLLFPHLAGVVHHGGAGTTAASLRCGLPNVILPVLGDQLYWGRRVAALGAGEAPIPLNRVDPETLAGRLATFTGDPRYRNAAAGLGAALAREPGVAAAVARIDAMTSAQVGQP